MSIYIFQPSGAGSTPTFQQVLNAGSTLTTNTTIDVNGFAYVNVNGNFNYETPTGNCFFQFSTMGGNCFLQGYDTVIGGINGINVNLITRVFSFGDIVSGNFIFFDGNLGQCGIASTSTATIVNGATITENTDQLIFNSITPGALTTASSTGFSGLHLIVQIDGNQYVIKLENP